MRIVHGGRTIVDTTRALRVEEGGPPTFYVPRDDVRAALVVSARSTVCPWKGSATYWSLGDSPDVAWSYEDPLPDAAALRGHVAFYASRVDECWVDDTRVEPQPGGYYGGWILDGAP